MVGKGGGFAFLTAALYDGGTSEEAEPTWAMLRAAMRSLSVGIGAGAGSAILVGVLGDDDCRKQPEDEADTVL